jgi:hypothetical protein
MYTICGDGKLEIGRDAVAGRDDFHVGWFSPSWVPFKRRWWFFRLRLSNGFGLTILGFQISWWRR